MLSFHVFGQQWCTSEPTNIDTTVKKMPARAKTEITIPIVVHVIYTEAEENTPDTQIHAQIDALKQDFRALNSDLPNVINHYTNKVADMEINFELATTDPQGNPHSGIIRQVVPPSFWNTTTSSDGRRRICYDDLNGSSAWCTDCYLNIWVVKKVSNAAFAGIGIFPTQIGNDVPKEEDGVYIRYNRFGVSPPDQLGRTATHEIGHYLNLLHPWGANDPGSDCNATACCQNPLYDDYIEDTEWQIKTYLNECPTGLQQSCGAADNYQNFMGYATDECLIMFTNGQKARVWDALMTYRSGLLNPNCMANCVVSTNTPTPIDEWLGAAWINGRQLRMDIKTNNLNWELYDLQGRLINQWTSRFTGFQTVVVPNLSQGVYLLKAQKGNRFGVRKLLLP